MIRGVCGHIWEGPGQSAIVLQLNLDRHEEIFTLPHTTSARSPSGRKLKYQPDSSTPIVVRVSVSAPSLEEMPQSVQLWQARGTDERAMAERFAILPRIEIFNNSFCVVTILYRDYGFLLVGMTGNVRKITPNAPCKHNVIVSVEPALSNGKGGEPALHPLTNLNGPAGISINSSNNISNHYPPLIQSPPQPIRDDYSASLSVPSPQRPYDPLHNQQNMESAFVSPQRNAGDGNNNNNNNNKNSNNNHITAATIGIKKGSNFFHYTRPVAAAGVVVGGGENNSNNNNTRQNADSSLAATTTTPTSIIAPKYSVNGVYLLPVNNSGGGVVVVAGPNSENNNNNSMNNSSTPSKIENSNNNHHIVEISPLSEKVKEDIAALHHRRTDYASVKRKHGFVSPIVPDDLKFKQPPGVNTPAIRVPSYGKNVYADHDDDDDEGNGKYNNKRASAGPRSVSGVLLVREEQTQTSRSESIIINSNNNNNSKRNGSTSPPPPPPPFPDKDSPRIIMVSAENNTPLSQSLSVGETFSVFCSRFKEWNEMLEDLALSYSARQTKVFESSYLALVNNKRK